MVIRSEPATENDRKYEHINRDLEQRQAYGPDRTKKAANMTVEQLAPCHFDNERAVFIADVPCFTQSCSVRARIKQLQDQHCAPSSIQTQYRELIGTTCGSTVGRS